MKINPTDEILKGVPLEKTKKPEKSHVQGFGEILKETLENSTKVETENKKPPMVNSIAQIQFPTVSAAEKTPIVGHVEKFLDILDEYQQKLGDPQFTLKDIFPLIDNMETEKERLIPVLNSLPDGNGLKDILNKALITSSVEIIKFNRGDYLNP
jgi:hypothetical protein